MKPSRDGKIKARYMRKLVKEWLEKNEVTKHTNLDVDPTHITASITAKRSAKVSGGSE